MRNISCPTLEDLEFGKLPIIRELRLDRDGVLQDNIDVVLVNTGRLEEDCLVTVEEYDKQPNLVESSKWRICRTVMIPL